MWWVNQWRPIAQARRLSAEPGEGLLRRPARMRRTTDML